MSTREVPVPGSGSSEEPLTDATDGALPVTDSVADSELPPTRDPDPGLENPSPHAVSANGREANGRDAAGAPRPPPTPARAREVLNPAPGVEWVRRVWARRPASDVRPTSQVEVRRVRRVVRHVDL